MDKDQHLKLDEIEELEQRIAPASLGGGNSLVMLDVVEKIPFELPNGGVQDWPAAAGDGLSRAITGGGK